MKKHHIAIASAISAITSANAAIVAGASQRYQANDYNGTTWTNTGAIGAAANATAVGTFTSISTPGGATAIANTGAGEQMNFSDGSSLNSTGFTIQAVIQIQDNDDNRQSPLGFDQSASWGGIFMGARSNGNLQARAGTQTSGSNTGLLSTTSTPSPAIAAGTWGILTLAIDTSNLTTPFTYSFNLLSDGSSVFSFTDVGDGTANATAGIGTAGRLFGGETGVAEPTTDAWLGAIADLVIYQSVLTPAQITENNAEFTNLYAVPEPSTYALAGLGLVGLASRRRR